MKITKTLTHVVTATEFEGALCEDELETILAAYKVQGFPAELDIAERTEDHVQMMSLTSLLGFTKASGVSAVTFDVTYFPHADDAEIAYQLSQLAHDLEINEEIIAELCADEIKEYARLDAKRDASIPVHSIVEAYIGGTAFAWYGINEYPRLKRVILKTLMQEGEQAQRAFITRASKAQVDLLQDY